MLNAVHLHTFVDVMRTGSFAVTARRLGYTPSAVSQQVSALERATRVQLFERDASGIRPTAAAEHLVAETQLALGSLQAVEDTFAQLASGRSGPLRMGSFPTASQRLVPKVLSLMERKHPGIDIRLDEGEPGELASMIRTRELDVAIVYQYDAVPETLRGIDVEEELLTEDVVLAVPRSHRLAEEGSTSIEALREDQWISTRRGTAAIQLLERLCATAEFVPGVVHQSNDYAVIQELVAAELGIALVPALGRLDDPRLRFLRLDADRTVRRVLAVVNPSGAGPAVETLLTHLRSAARFLARDEPLLRATTRV